MEMLRVEAEALTECRCGGSGQIQWRESNRAMSGLGTALCPCRKSLPVREGNAAWWTTERVYEATVDIPIFSELVSIAVNAEVPISGDNYRVQRRGNRYYPTLVDLDVGKESLLMHGDTARRLGQALIAAADASDAVDQADCDPCGHWAPCDCKQAEAEGRAPLVAEG
jgi:hypothetical protein